MFGKHKMSLWCADAMLLNSQQIFTSTKPHRWQGRDDAEPSNLLDYSWFIPWQPLQRCSFLHLIVWVKTAIRTVLYLKLDRLWSEVLQWTPCAGSITAPCLPGDSLPTLCNKGVTESQLITVTHTGDSGIPRHVLHTTVSNMASLN